LHVLDANGVEIGTGPVIDIHFSDEQPLTDCVGNGTAPCQLGVTPTDACVTELRALSAAAPATLDVGNVSVGTLADSTPRDAGSGPADLPASNIAIPACRVLVS